MKIQRRRLSRLLPGVSILVLSAGCASMPLEKPSFSAALANHLQTIDQRDLEAFSKTLTNEEELHVIFPGGTALTDKTAILEFHEGWFNNQEWVFKPDTVKIIEGNDMAMALLTYDYQDTVDEDARSSWLVLVFQLQDNEWRLVHDQNTRIPAAQE